MPSASFLFFPWRATPDAGRAAHTGPLPAELQPPPGGLAPGLALGFLLRGAPGLTRQLSARRGSSFWAPSTGTPCTRKSLHMQCFLCCLVCFPEGRLAQSCPPSEEACVARASFPGFGFPPSSSSSSPSLSFRPETRSQLPQDTIPTEAAQKASGGGPWLSRGT